MNVVIVEQLLTQFLEKCDDDLYIECNFYYMARALKNQVAGTYMEEGMENSLDSYRESHAGYRLIIISQLLNRLKGSQGWIV